jgi:Flp pilus assembly protein TadB
VTAASTFTGGVLHLAIIPMFFAFTPVNVMIFFLVSGAGQLFWVIPVLKRWSNVWYYIGVGGTAILIALFVIAVPARGQKEQRRLKWSQVESPRAIDIMGISSMYGSNTSRSLDTLATKITSDPLPVKD